MNRDLLLPSLAMLFLSACMKEELPVLPQDRGEAVELQVCMGPGYRDQIWIDLSSGSVVSTNSRSAWDLAFQSDADGWRVWLNGARLMTAWDLGAVDLAAPQDTLGMNAARRIDAPSGHPDSTAFGNAWGTGKVFVVDLGYSELGTPLGYIKMRPDAFDAMGYTFTIAAMDGTGVTTVQLPKDPTRSRTYFKFSAGSAVAIEPPQGEWDMVITQYTHQFYEPFLPYLVTGVLTDQSTTRVARIPSADFDLVQLSDTAAHPFSTARNTIGYDWKVYDFDLATYTVFPSIVHIIQDGEGRSFKLHFIDFYSSQGMVGCPTFRVQEL